MDRQSFYPGSEQRHVSLVALPDAGVATLSGIFDVMNAFAFVGMPGARAVENYHGFILLCVNR
jgi:hypothetical protein